MSRILIDLTDLELWGGQHGGTQRVTYGIAKEYYLKADSLEQEVLFISFSKRQKKFHQSNFQPIYDRAELQAATQGAGVVSAGLGRKAKLKQRLLPYIPESVKRSHRARKIARKSLAISLQLVTRARTTVASVKPSPIHTDGEPISFVADDTVLILGKPWDDMNIQRLLTREKAKLHFKLVQVVYDLIIPLNPQFHHPSLFTDYTQNMFEAIDASDLLLPISQSSLKDLKIFCKRLNLRLPETKVIRLGDEVLPQGAKASKPDDRIGDEFIACVGTMEIRKNHSQLYYAYKLAQQRGVTLPQLIIVGSRGWLTGDLQYLIDNDPNIKNDILILDNISDAGLEWVYRNCRFTIYPSMYEGWGLPVAESLARGKVCIATNTSSVPEIAGDLIDYFSPYNTQECLDMIMKYLDPAVLPQKEHEISSKYTSHSWGETFQTVHRAIKGL